MQIQKDVLQNILQNLINSRRLRHYPGHEEHLTRSLTFPEKNKCNLKGMVSSTKTIS
jgi:hypothetical protein